MANLYRSAFFLLAILPGIGAAPSLLPGQPLHPGQTGATPDSGAATEITFHLHGTVVDGVTGKPVERVLVTSMDRRLATMTDINGAFAFDIRFGGIMSNQMQSTGSFGDLKVTPDADNLRMAFQVQKPGYLAVTNPLSVAFAGTAAEATFKIMPAGVISGHVFADAGATPRDVTVTLLAHNPVNGERRWISAGVQHTGRDGGFRFTNLRPGEYTVMTAEWRGDQPGPSQRNTVSQEYPPVFFGDTSSVQSSTKLHVHYGEVAQTDLHLRLARYYPVKVPIDGPANAGVMVRVNSADALEGFQLGYNQADHAVEGALPSGTYTLSLSCFRPQQAFGTAVLHVADAAVQASPVALVPPAPVTVRLHREFTGSQSLTEPVTTGLFLQPEGQGWGVVNGNSKPGEDEFVLQDVAPGRYTLHVQPSYGYAASMQYAGVDLATQPLVIGDGGATEPIDITLRDDSGQLEGTVPTSGGSLPPSTFACLVPLTPGGQPVFTPTGLDGRFTVANVVPGSYRLFATTQAPWGLPWHDAEFQRSLDTKGVAVTISPKATLQMDAPLLEDAALELP